MKDLYRPYCNEKYVFERFKDWFNGQYDLQLTRLGLDLINTQNTSLF